MGSRYLSKITSKIPLSDEQLGALYSMVEAMADQDTAILFQISNYRETGDIMAVFIEWSERGRLVELDYPMDEYRWKYPLVLARHLSVEKTKELLRRTLRDLEETEDIDFVFSGFRRVKAVRYGEPEEKCF